MSTTSLSRCTRHSAQDIPPVLSSTEVSAVLTGAVEPPRPAVGRRAHRDVTRRSGPAREAYPDPVFAPQPTSTQDLPDARVWVSRFSLALLECLEGRRPPAQLSKHVDPDVLARVNRRYRAAVRRGRRPGPTRIKRVRVCQPRDGVAEAAVVTRLCGRPTPLALRLVGMDGRWVVTVLEML